MFHLYVTCRVTDFLKLEHYTFFQVKISATTSNSETITINELILM